MKQTKVVNCGTTTFVYDFKARKLINEFEFELGRVKRNTTDLKRLLLTNFTDDTLLTSFTLGISLDEYTGLQNKIYDLLQAVSNPSSISYLAVAELPANKSDSNVTVHVVTSINIHDLITDLDAEMDNKGPEEILESLWGSVVYIDLYSPEVLVHSFTSAYEKTLNSPYFKSNQFVLFKHNLMFPVVLWNDEAETFLKEHQILDYPVHRTNEFYDSKAGFVIENVYSVFDTSIPSQEIDYSTY